MLWLGNFQHSVPLPPPFLPLVSPPAFFLQSTQQLAVMCHNHDRPGQAGFWLLQGGAEMHPATALHALSHPLEKPAPPRRFQFQPSLCLHEHAGWISSSSWTRSHGHGSRGNGCFCEHAGLWHTGPQPAMHCRGGRLLQAFE